MQIFTFVLMSVLVFFAGNPARTIAADAPVHGTFALFEVEPTWTTLSSDEKTKGVQEATALVESFKDRVTFDSYWTFLETLPKVPSPIEFINTSFFLR